MREDHYRSEALTFITDLANSPPNNADDLTRRWVQSGLAADAALRASVHDLDDLQRFLCEWEDVIDAHTEHDRVHALNGLLTRAAAYPRITNHDGSGWHLHYRDDNVALSHIIRAVTVVAAADHLTKFGMHRLGRCRLEECNTAFVDVTRAGCQRYCSRMCANRDAVRRHRSRKTQNNPGARDPAGELG